MKTSSELRASFNKSEKQRKKVVKTWNNYNHETKGKQNERQNKKSKV